MIDFFVRFIGFTVLSVGSALVVTFIFALAASVMNKHLSEIQRAATQTYWWSRWIRWHRIARARKDKRRGI